MKKGLKIGITVLVVIIGCSFIFRSIDKKSRYCYNSFINKIIKYINLMREGEIYENKRK